MRGTRAELVGAWLRLAADAVEAHSTSLTQLDAAIGDGDHGINLERGFRAARTALGRHEDASSSPVGATPPGRSAGNGAPGPSGGELLQLTGRTLVSTVGGASGPLYGTFFLEMGAALDDRDDEADAAAIGAAFVAGADAVARRGRSRVGEKTMLDALVPAADAWLATAGAGRPMIKAAQAAAEAAHAGRLATVSMIATKGRASYLGERSRGHADPGATSAAILIDALVPAST